MTLSHSPESLFLHTNVTRVMLPLPQHTPPAWLWHYAQWLPWLSASVRHTWCSPVLPQWQQISALIKTRGALLRLHSYCRYCFWMVPVQYAWLCPFLCLCCSYSTGLLLTVHIEISDSQPFFKESQTLCKSDDPLFLFCGPLKVVLIHRLGSTDVTEQVTNHIRPYKSSMRRVDKNPKRGMSRRIM